jgi:hypothetical protein
MMDENRILTVGNAIMPDGNATNPDGNVTFPTALKDITNRRSRQRGMAISVPLHGSRWLVPRA